MFILAEKASFPIDWMCRKLKVARASFYRSLRPAAPTRTQVRHTVLDAHVVRVLTREKGMAGRDQITTILGPGVWTWSVGLGSGFPGFMRSLFPAASKKNTSDCLNNLTGAPGTEDLRGLVRLANKVVFIYQSYTEREESYLPGAFVIP
ncbi:hypothetical protein [Cryobacterium sp. Y50]|uniref:hypothetical protein n=1 Tax=Cryobacterium sp. Y50 TaxID=2048286 RepID=UPI0018EA98F0|nr:hypothetical protein [Cryobacterium sp. Y50]